MYWTSSNTHCYISLLADDTKCLKIIVSSLDSFKLQEDLNFQTSNWYMQFGLPKIFMLSFKNNFFTSYKIGTFTIPCIDFHKDLRIIVSSGLSWDAHYKQISKSYQVLGLLRRTFSLQNYIKAKTQLAIYIYIYIYIVSDISVFLLLYNFETPPKKAHLAVRACTEACNQIYPKYFFYSD